MEDGSDAVDTIHHLQRTFEANQWSFMPVYPRGHVQIQNHLPWGVFNVFFPVVLTTATLWCVRRVMVVLVPPVGRRAGIALHGKAWLEPGGHGRTVDWRRFSNVVHCTLLHISLSAYVMRALWAELSDWFADPSLWWLFMQPSLSPSLRAYYLFEIGVTWEATLTMLGGVLTGRPCDTPMMVHHAATLAVLLFAWRFGFARVGAAVLAMHDASDVPIDVLRLGQALESDTLIYSGAAGAVLSWAYLRVYCFPRYVIASAVLQTTHLRVIFAFMGPTNITAGYVLYVAPLVLLWLLSCAWLYELLSKVLAKLVGSPPRARLARFASDPKSGSVRRRSREEAQR